MKIALLSFTERGAVLARKAASTLEQQGDTPRHTHAKDCKDFSLTNWAAQAFKENQALIFVGATGIAVRAVAPLLKSKTTDPAVVVMDEQGRFAISLLSGHIGGANDLTCRLADSLGAVPVITTATDLAGAFAADSWAVRRGLRISNPSAIKLVSGKVLQGESVTLQSDFPVQGLLPNGVVLADVRGDMICSFYVGREPALRLVPPIGVLGVGCKKGISSQALAQAWSQFQAETHLDRLAVKAVATIDLKAEEQGLLAFCREMGWPLNCYSAEELRGASGEFSASEFVRSVTGVDNVCERAAVLACGGRVLIPKRAGEGVTMAFAAPDYTLMLGE